MSIQFSKDIKIIKMEKCGFQDNVSGNNGVISF